jgi:rhomboid protease GluP
MESPTDVRALVEQGDALLLDGQVREAAADYARAVQIDPAAVGGHLGLAKANFALGTFAVVYLACKEVLKLAADSAQAALAQALLYILDRHYDPAIQELDRVAQLDPGQAYAHALRGYCLRALNRTYDAQQAEGKARRLSSGKDFGPLFPRLDPVPVVMPYPSSAPGMQPSNGSTANGAALAPPPARPIDPAEQMRRMAIRARFATRSYPIVTFALIGVNVLIYLLTALLGGSLFSPGNNLLYGLGVEDPRLMAQDPLQWYRLLTAMFLHASIAHIGVNMLSLYFVGVITERIFSSGRFAAIYFASGLLGGVADFLFSPAPSLGASGAIFGIFGAFGAFILLRRQMLGRQAGLIIGQWLFWLVLNLAFSFTPGIATFDHFGGLIAGFVLGALLIPRSFNIGRG